MNASLRTHARVLIGLLTLQYLVGMYVNLFVQFPDETGGELWGFAWSQLPLALHIILAILIFIGSVALCIRAARSRDKTWLWASGIGFVAITAAGVSGALFIPSQNDMYSYGMALAFIVAISVYSWATSVPVRDPVLRYSS